jgi:hypothetical protein
VDPPALKENSLWLTFFTLPVVLFITLPVVFFIPFFFFFKIKFEKLVEKRFEIKLRACLKLYFRNKDFKYKNWTKTSFLSFSLFFFFFFLGSFLSFLDP